MEENGQLAASEELIVQLWIPVIYSKVELHRWSLLQIHTLRLLLLEWGLRMADAHRNVEGLRSLDQAKVEISKFGALEELIRLN